MASEQKSKYSKAKSGQFCSNICSVWEKNIFLEKVIHPGTCRNDYLGLRIDTLEKNRSSFITIKDNIFIHHIPSKVLSHYFFLKKLP